MIRNTLESFSTLWERISTRIFTNKTSASQRLHLNTFRPGPLRGTGPRAPGVKILSLCHVLDRVKFEDMKPKRIQLMRTKGWKMPKNTVKVDRSTPWGNPHRVVPPDPKVHPSVQMEDAWHMPATPEAAVNYFKRYLKNNPHLVRRARKELRGKNLACWCKPGAPCHADVLLEIANK